MTISKIACRVRGLFAGNYPENKEDEQFHINNRGDLIVAMGLPQSTEIVRLGRSYHVMGSAVASLTAVATTTAGLSLWNGEADGGKTYIIDSVHALFTVNSGAALVHVGIIGMFNTSRIAAPTDAALTMRRLNGKTKGDTLARTLAGGTVTNDGWFPIGNSVNSAVNALPGFQIDQPINGLYLVPPGGMFSIHTLGSVTTSSAILGIRWHETQLILG